MNICKKIGKGILNWKIDLKLVAVLAAACLVIVLVPLIRLSFYAVPWFDDYNYADSAKNFLFQDYSLSSAVEGALYSVRTNWYAWQGTFSSIFFMSLMPAVWGEELYFLGPLFLILILPFSVCVLSKVFIRNVLKADRTFCVIIQCVCAIMCVMLIYTAQGGFYWYNAGVHYVGMHSFFMLLLAGWIRLLTGAGKPASVLLVLWTLLGAVLSGGANYVTALQGGWRFAAS